MELAGFLALGERNITSTPEGKLATEGFNIMIMAMGSAPLDIPGTVHNKAKKVLP
jgi:hypothetical protein